MKKENRIDFLELRINSLNVSTELLNEYIHYKLKVINKNLNYVDCLTYLAIICDVEGHGSTYKKNISNVQKEIERFNSVMEIYK